MTQKELKELFEKCCEQNGKFREIDDDWLCDVTETYCIKDNKIFLIQKDHNYKFSSYKQEYNIKEVTELDYEIGLAKEYQKLLNMYDKWKEKTNE